jgi:hypothetical protein
VSRISQIVSSAALAPAQLDATKAKDADDTRLEEAKIATGMLQELIKSGAKQSGRSAGDDSTVSGVWTGYGQN